MLKWSACLSILAVAGCAAPPPSVTPLQSPAAAESLAPNLSVAPDGRVLLSWLEPGSAKEFALRYAIREKQGWSAPQTITTGTDWFVSGADYPTVAFMADGAMVANSLIATNLQAEAYDTNVFLSHDAGATWTKPVSLHRDKKQRQHGFVSFVPAPGGRLGAVWLDGRNLSEENEGDMSLFYTTIGKDGSLEAETVLDGRVCECCQTAAAATSEGLIVVYRDRSPKEVRDIAAVRYVEGHWSEPAPVSNDGWMIEGCPVNGPAVAANGRNVAVAWMTAPDEKSRVNVAFSTDAGRTFGKAIRVDDGKGEGNVDIALLESGAAVTWAERGSGGKELRIRHVEPDGTLGAALTVSGGDVLDYGAFPRIKRSGNDLLVTWTAGGDKSAVHTAVVYLP
jgi:hypothetical protein